MTTAPRQLRRPLPRWALLFAALVLGVGQTIAAAHVHLDEPDEQEEQACSLCAIAEPGHVPDAVRVDAQPSGWKRSNRSPVYSAIRSPHPYAIGRPRAPPVSRS